MRQTWPSRCQRGLEPRWSVLWTALVWAIYSPPARASLHTWSAQMWKGRLARAWFERMSTAGQSWCPIWNESALYAQPRQYSQKLAQAGLSCRLSCRWCLGYGLYYLSATFYHFVETWIWSSRASWSNKQSCHPLHSALTRLKLPWLGTLALWRRQETNPCTPWGSTAGSSPGRDDRSNQLQCELCLCPTWTSSWSSRPHLSVSIDSTQKQARDTLD